MAGYPTFTATDLAGFSGRPEASYSAYAASAIAQATLLFRLATGLTDWPTDADAVQLATFAIEAMADTFVLSQPFQAAVVAPFQSETIGGYSYSKAMRQLLAGQPTGVMWFDLAVQRLGISKDVARVTSDSLELFERDLHVRHEFDGHFKLLGPEDIFPIDTPFSISQMIPFSPKLG